MVPSFISDFQISIGRHLDESKKLCIESGSRTASTPGTSAKLAIEEMSIDYLDALENLREKISGTFATAKVAAKSV